MKNQLIDNPLEILKKLLLRYNFVIFVVLASVGLSVSILTLNDILNRPYNSSDASQTTKTIFDQPTADSITVLRGSTTNNAYKNLPPGRINPFAE